MNKRINSVLEEIRHQLEADEGGKAAYGPGIAADVGGKSTADAEAGVGEAENPSDVGDTLDLYLGEIADLLTLEYDMPDEEAMSFVFSAAEALEKDGLVPPMPEDDAADEDIVNWLGKAKTVRFGAHVMSRAREMAIE